MRDLNNYVPLYPNLPFLINEPMIYQYKMQERNVLLLGFVHMFT